MSKRYRNTAFLVELIINILVFSISCAVLVGLFGKAGQISRRSHEQTFASNEVLALVEKIKVRGADGLPHGQWLDEENALCYYDAGWNGTDDTTAPYLVRLQMVTEEQEAGVLMRLEAVAETSDGQLLYSVKTASYTPAEGGAAP